MSAAVPEDSVVYDINRITVEFKCTERGLFHQMQTDINRITVEFK